MNSMYDKYVLNKWYLLKRMDFTSILFFIFFIDLYIIYMRAILINMKGGFKNVYFWRIEVTRKSGIW
jgi:hypothetical protein